MAKNDIKTITVLDRGTNSATIQFNSSKFKFNGYQIHKLKHVVDKLAVDSQAGLPDDEGVEISGIEA